MSAEIEQAKNIQKNMQAEQERQQGATSQEPDPNNPILPPALNKDFNAIASEARFKNANAVDVVDEYDKS